VRVFVRATPNQPTPHTKGFAKTLDARPFGRAEKVETHASECPKRIAISSLDWTLDGLGWGLDVT
jgi:hypothetical protein